jgi:hypothetical protein
MKLTLFYKVEPVQVLDRLSPIGDDEIVGNGSRYERLLFIDDNPVPPSLAEIILLGLDTATEQYTNSILKKMRKEGHDV